MTSIENNTDHNVWQIHIAQWQASGLSQASYCLLAHITSLMGDTVNSKLMGMTKVVSDDSARRALWKIDEEAGVRWLQDHLAYCYSPLLSQPWILDADVTIKTLYGKQEGAVVGHNPHKPAAVPHIPFTPT